MPSACWRQAARLGATSFAPLPHQRANRKCFLARLVRKSSQLKGRRQLWHVLENGRALACFWHHREMIATFWAGLRQYCLFNVQIERLVLNVRASRADADQRALLNSKFVMMSSMIAPERTAHSLACLW